MHNCEQIAVPEPGSHGPGPRVVRPKASFLVRFSYRQRADDPENWGFLDGIRLCSPDWIKRPAHYSGGQMFESPRVDLSSHNANPPGVFDGEPVPLSDVADTRIAESVAALRRFVAEPGSLPTAETWT